MRRIKRWLVLMLTVTMAMSDCGSITVFATEDAAAVETSDSENDEGETKKSEDLNVLSEEPNEDENHAKTDSTQDEDTASETDSAQVEDITSETDTEIELPFLHIGQINEGEELPSPEDSEFVYDLPVSFEMSDSVLLFVNYSIDIMPEAEEKGTLVWSILRGEKGLEEGSASLMNEEDDWTGFEVVSESPYFTMTENEDEESDYYQTVELVAKAKEVSDEEASEGYEDYNYYIRAAYYPGAEGEAEEIFYAAATIAFLPIEDTDIDEAQDDTLDAEEIDTDEIQDDEAVTEAMEAVEDEALNAALPEEPYRNTALEEEDVESGTHEEFGEKQDSEKQTRSLILTIGDAAAETSIEMQPGDTRQVIATIVSEDDQEDPQEDPQEEIPVEPSEIVIVWKSSNGSVASVENDLITAKAEGYAQITAECEYEGESLTASVRVEVVQDEKLLDLSGDIWVAGFQQESEDLVYTGQKITQDFRVYYNETLLKEKTDYTLTYKNNVNAAAYDSAKAPSVTIKLKGQYSGSRTLYFTIKPRELEASMGYEQVVNHAAKLKIPAPTLYYNNKKLALNKDFFCDYQKMPKDYTNGASYENDGSVYEYTVNGMGNFTGSCTMRLAVIWDKNLNLESATVTLKEKQYEYSGEPLSDKVVLIDSVKFGKNDPLDRGLYEYEVHADGVGTGYLEVVPSTAGRKNGYRGMKKVTFKVVGDRQIKYSRTVNGGWQPEIVFSQKSVNEYGGMIQAKTGVLVYVGEDSSKSVELVEGKDYTVKYSNNKKVGTATATFTGMGRYTGTYKQTYKIMPNEGKSGDFRIIWKNVTQIETEKIADENVTDENDKVTLEIPYQKGGAVPDFVLMDQDGNVLSSKTDYTVKLSNNKNAEEIMTCVISGKGNYKGYSLPEKKIRVIPANIGREGTTISVADKQYSPKANAWQSNPTITDVNGKKLTAGTDYEYDKSVDYSYDKAKMISDGVLEADTTVTITVHGKNNYAGSIKGTYRIYETSISTLKITIETKDYTGSEITLSKADIHVYATSTDQKNKIEIEDKERYYEIVEESYKNNIKAGTAKVTLRGLEKYGGTRTCSFKINKKAYLINQVKGITLDQPSLQLFLQGDNEEKGILTAEIKSADETKALTNPMVIWTTSNSKVATVEGLSITKDSGASGSIKTTATARIHLKGEGTVKITATTQDGGKKATCTVTIVDVPVLAEQIIPMSPGATHKLKFENDDSPEFNLNGVKFETSNSEIVSVDNEGLLTANKVGAVVIKVTKGKVVQQCYIIVQEGEEVIPEKFDKFTQKTGSTNDTVAIKNAIYRAYQDLNLDGIYIPAGVYWIDAAYDNGYGIRIRGKDDEFLRTNRENGFEIRLSPSALLMTIGNSRDEDFHTIWIADCKNITISGGAIVGERNEHNGTKGESGHGIGIYNSTNIHIKDMDISQCWGDGIYLGTNPNPDVTNNGITITNCNVHNNRRNNLSITDADGVTIDNCHFDNAKGTAPQFGIDIETNDKNKPCKNITISNSYMLGNAKASMGIMTPAEDIRLENCVLDGIFYNMAGTRVVLSNTEVKGGVVGTVTRE